ncbi:MAG: transcriptional repressor NrdR [Fibrobacter sp.]|nr:transcriptional repressor NrdR [Fibrobacter sp.]
MLCPFCKHDKNSVVDSRATSGAIRRRRECSNCSRRFTTYEYVEKVPLTVVKRDETREAFAREKLLNGIMTACKKRPISRNAIDEIVNDIENTLMNGDSQEVSYEKIGNLVMDALSSLDAVAYVRFASVYREFKEVDEFLDQVKNLKD